MVRSLKINTLLVDAKFLEHLHKRILVRYWVNRPAGQSYEMILVTLLAGISNERGKTERLFILNGTISVANAFSSLNANYTWGQSVADSEEKLRNELSKWERGAETHKSDMFFANEQCVVALVGEQNVQQSPAHSPVAVPIHFATAQCIATSTKNAVQTQCFAPGYTQMLELIDRRFSAFTAQMRHSCLNAIGV